jgi:hypothetical protein
MFAVTRRSPPSAQLCISAFGVRVVAAIESLVSLSFSGLGTFDNAVLHALGSGGTLRRLAALDISSTSVNDSGVKLIPELFAGLAVLRCTRISLTDGGAVHLRTMGSLRELDVGRTKITDATLAAWSGGASSSIAKALVSLSLCGTLVTAKCAAALASFAALNRLDLRDCGITSQELLSVVAPRIASAQPDIVSFSVITLIIDFERASSTPPPRKVSLPNAETEEPLWLVSEIRKLIQRQSSTAVSQEMKRKSFVHTMGMPLFGSPSSWSRKKKDTTRDDLSDPETPPKVRRRLDFIEDDDYVHDGNTR